MRRRNFIGLLGSIATAWPLVALAQQGTGPQQKKVYRIGFLFAGTIALRPQAQEFWKALNDLGYVQGNNLIIEVREARGELNQLPRLAAELVDTHPDVIVAVTNAAVTAAKNATQRIPIVMAIARDPVLNGYAKSLARPEGNITGTSNTVSPEIVGKRMQLLVEMLPGLSVIGMIWNPKNEGTAGLVAFAEQVASSFGNPTISLPFQGPGELKDVLEKSLADHVGALLVMPDPVEFDHRREIIDFTVAKRIPTLHPFPEEAEDGALAAYGSRLSDEYRRPAYYVDKILKGVAPSDLPIQQPTKFEFVVNLKTAKTLNVIIPTSVLIGADKVIE
ncbi:MAG: ABC transporter substrate-binding protein [Xanthobacteraceae bacterium]